MTDLAVETWGSGTTVVLVHGSLATGVEEWQEQRPLAEEGFGLLVLDRRGYGGSPSADGEDFLQDADDLCEVIDGVVGGVHLVGHSYGALGVLVAAARCPERVRSMALLEPAALALAQQDPGVRAFLQDVQRLWDTDLPDEEWVQRFLRAVGSDPVELPPGVLDAAVPLVPLLRRGRPVWSGELPLAEVAAAGFGKVVVSGGHSPVFDAICDDLADRIGAARAEVCGAGHEVQFAGPEINQVLLQLWRGTAASP